MTRCWIPALALGMAALGPGSAWAGRPFFTEDAGVLGDRRCELEGALTQTRDNGDRQRVSSLQLGCGTAWSSQFALAYERSTADESSAHSWKLGGKTRLFGSDEEPRWTVAWGASWTRDNQHSDHMDNPFVSLVHTRSLGAGWTLNAQAGLQRDRLQGRTLRFGGLAAEYALSEQQDVGIEVFHTGSGRPWVAVGTRWQAAEGWEVNVAAGRQSGDGRCQYWTLGFKRSF